MRKLFGYLLPVIGITFLVFIILAFQQYYFSIENIWNSDYPSGLSFLLGIIMVLLGAGFSYKLFVMGKELRSGIAIRWAEVSVSIVLVGGLFFMYDAETIISATNSKGEKISTLREFVACFATSLKGYNRLCPLGTPPPTGRPIGPKNN